MSDLHRLAPGDDPGPIIEEYNAFHDGFVRSIALASRDRFTRVGPRDWDVAHETTGQFAAVIDFAHYNYDGGIQPLDRLVRATFRGVREFALDLRGFRSYEWPLKLVAIEAATRPTEAAAAPPETCFALTLTWSHIEGTTWTEAPQRLLTFTHATFEDATEALEG
jgi:hypothetical protein